MGDVDLGEGCTTRIGSSRASTQVQAGAVADHDHRRSQLDRDLGNIMAVILGVDVARTIDFINQAERTAEAVTTTEGTLPPIPTPTSRATTIGHTTPHRSSRKYDATSSPPAASPSPDPGTSAPAAPTHFAGIARRVRRGKSDTANVSLASSVPHPPAPCESASLVSPATAVEPTFDRSLCVETFPGISLGPEVCLLYTSPSPRDKRQSRMPSSA